jgi:HK97 family phage major capsid protein
MSVDQSRVRELQNALSAKSAENKDIIDSAPFEGSTLVLTQEKADAFAANMKSIREIKGLLADITEMDNVNSWNSDPAGGSVAAAYAAAAAQVQSMDSKSLGDLFMESAEFKALQGGKAGVNMPAPFTLQKGNIGNMWGPMNQKDVYSAMPSGTPGSFGTIQRDPMILPPMRTRRVRDLFPVRSTTAAVIEYFRMTGFTNNASVVAERNGGDTAFARKPQSGLQFTGMQAPIRTLAHWETAHRNALADEPQLRSIIDNELLYGLRLVEDAQILLGNGVGENLLGILNSGIQDYNWSAGASTPVKDTKADAIRRAATLAYLAFYEPTGVVLHPNDYEDIELTKNSQGTYLFSVSIQLGGEARMWRMPVVDTPAMPEGRALVGAFGTGAQLYDRDQASIRISENHEDFFVRNAIVILAEERLALAVKRPEAFVNVDFDMEPA